MKSLTKIAEELMKDLCLLQTTRSIVKDKQVDKIWEWLKQEYKTCDESNSINKALLSIVNSILHQKRIYFNITRRSAQTIVKSDKNFKERGGAFDNKVYSKILHTLIDEKFIEKIEQGNEKNASSYKVILPEILDYLKSTINEEDQFNQVIEFTKRNRAEDQLADQLADQVTKQQSNEVSKKRSYEEAKQHSNVVSNNKDAASMQLQPSLKTTVGSLDVEQAKLLTEYEVKFMSDHAQKEVSSLTANQLKLYNQIQVKLAKKVASAAQPSLVAPVVKKYDHQYYKDIVKNLITHTNKYISEEQLNKFNTQFAKFTEQEQELIERANQKRKADIFIPEINKILEPNYEKSVTNDEKHTLRIVQMNHLITNEIVRLVMSIMRR